MEITPEYTPVAGSGWTAAEREIAIRLRASANSSSKEIAETLRKEGYERSPKAILKFFERIGLTGVDAKAKTGYVPVVEFEDPMDKIYDSTPIKTSWGEPMIIEDKKVEFGHGTSVVPVVFLPDVHAPFQDDRAFELACKIIELVKPVAVIYLGDVVDWHQISSFDKDPDRIQGLQFEVDKFHELDRMVMSAAGNSVPRYSILGNHEDRLRRYQSSNPEISKVRGLQFDAMLGLGPSFQIIPNFQLVDGEINWRDRFIAKHGKIVSKWSAWSAQKEHMAEHRNGISGHTHRAGDYYMTQRGQVQKWTESGCLCSLEPTYMRNPNWQHAVTVANFNGDGTTDFFNTNLVVFSNYQAIVNGTFLSVKNDQTVMSK